MNNGAQQLWHEHVKVISNQLDIHFIHSNILGWPCKNIALYTLLLSIIFWFLHVEAADECFHMLHEV